MLARSCRLPDQKGSGVDLAIWFVSDGGSFSYKMIHAREHKKPLWLTLRRKGLLQQNELNDMKINQIKRGHHLYNAKNTIISHTI